MVAVDTHLAFMVFPANFSCYWPAKRKGKREKEKEKGGERRGKRKEKKKRGRL
jgi:hypothetical protein